MNSSGLGHSKSLANLQRHGNFSNYTNEIPKKIKTTNKIQCAVRTKRLALQAKTHGRSSKGCWCSKTLRDHPALSPLCDFLLFPTTFPFTPKPGLNVKCQFWTAVSIKCVKRFLKGWWGNSMSKQTKCRSSASGPKNFLHKYPTEIKLVCDSYVQNCIYIYINKNYIYIYTYM